MRDATYSQPHRATDHDPDLYTVREAGSGTVTLCRVCYQPVEILVENMCDDSGRTRKDIMPPEQVQWLTGLLLAWRDGPNG
jgi:hypothetical protein